MTFMEALKYKPAGFWLLDDAPTYADCSGWAKNATFTGTAQSGLPVHSNATKSILVDSSKVLKTPSKVFNDDSRPFTLEASIAPVIRSAPTEVPQTYYENRIADPKPQTGYWSSSNQAVHQRTFTMTADGRPAVRITRGETSALAIYGARAAGYESPITAAVGGETFTITFKLRSNISTTMTLQIGYGTGSLSVNGMDQNLPLVADTPTLFKITLTVPSTGAHIGQQIFPKFFSPAGGGSVGDWYQAWDVGWYSGEYSEQYFDGDMLGYKWTGAANNSFSVVNDNVNEINVIPNANGNNTLNIANQNGTVGRGEISDPSLFGPYSIRATRTQSGTGENRLAAYLNAYIPTKRKYYASCWVYTSVARSMAVQVARAFISNGALNFVAGPNVAVPANTWTRLHFEFDATGFRNIERLQVVGQNVAQGEFFYVDGIQVSWTNTPYFDGSFDYAKWYGAEDNSYSYIPSSQGEQSVLSNLNVLDGLTINGTVVSFKTIHSNGQTVTTSYDIGNLRKVHLVGQYNGIKNMLYVDGQLVAEADTPSSKIVASDTFLYSGPAASSQGLFINGLGMYSAVLADHEVAALARAARYHFSDDDQSGYRAEAIDVSLIANKPYIECIYEDEYPGSLVNVSQLDGELIPSEYNGVSVEGQWIFTIALSYPDINDTLRNSYASWSGQGFIVEAALDDNVWFTVVKNKDIAQLKNYAATDKQITFRVTFTEGSVDSFLNSFVFRSFNTTSFDSNGFTYTLQGSMQPFEDAPVFDYPNNRGLILNEGASLMVKRAATDTDGINPKTIEIVVKQIGVDAPSLAAATSPNSVYTNGVLENTYGQGKFVIKHLVSNTGFNTASNIIISGNVQVLSVKTYPDALTQANVNEIIANYTGINKTRVSDGAVLAIAEPAASATIYAYDWATSSSTAL